MKILHVIPSIPDVRGGTSRAVLDIVKALHSINVDVQIATTNDNGDELLDVPLNRLIEYKHVPVWFFERFSPKLRAIREYAFSSGLTSWLWNHINEYDLIHIHAIFSYASTMAMAIARMKNVPYVVLPHGLLCEWSLQQGATKKQIYLNLIEKANLNAAKTIQFTSEQERQEVANLGLFPPSYVLPLGLTPPETIPNADKLVRSRFNIPAQETIILFLSRWHPKKGLDYLIPALGKLIHHKFTFILAGSGTPEYEAEVKSLLAKHNLSDRTRVVGFVEGKTKDLIIQGSDLFVLTSHSENFGVAVLEALAAGVPALVTPGVALAPIIKQHQLGYVPQLDIDAISVTLENYLTNPHLGKIAGEKSRKFILDNYTWEAIAIQLTQLYRDILTQKNLNQKKINQN
ncbi:MAG: glycosyltransferase [Cyanobacteria bacterium P01_A01_bin.84]